MSVDLGKALAYVYRIDDSFERVRVQIVFSGDVRTEVDMLYQSVALHASRKLDVINSDFLPVTNELFRYIEKRNRFTDISANYQTLDEFLTGQDFQLSRIVALLTTPAKPISEVNLFDIGHWEFEFELLDEAKKFVFYHFDLQISSDELFDNVLFEINSNEDITNWFLERDVDEFNALSVGGAGSNFATRRIRYISKEAEFLERTKKYYIRVRQKDNEGKVYDYRTFSEDIIFT